MKTYNNTQMTSAATNNLAKTGNDLAQQAFRKQGSVWHCAGRVGLVHQFVKDWINKAIPRRKDKVLKLLNAHEQRMIIQTTRLCGKLTPLFCSSKALARGIGRLPNHINCAHECHRQAHACHNQRALVAANDQSERSRARKNLQEAKRVACSFVKPPESKSVLSRESRLFGRGLSTFGCPFVVPCDPPPDPPPGLGGETCVGIVQLRTAPDPGVGGAGRAGFGFFVAMVGPL